MVIKIILTAISLVWLLVFYKNEDRRNSLSFPSKNVIDTFPAITTIADADIDTVTGVYKTKTITIKLKTGKMLSYDISKWDYLFTEKLKGKILDAVNTIQMTFTKAEQMPAFPGGDEAWDNYVKKFSVDNKELLQGLNHGSINLPFIVDTNGELSLMEGAKPATMTETQSKLFYFVEELLKNSPPWIPGKQNGHKVVCLRKTVLEF